MSEREAIKPVKDKATSYYWCYWCNSGVTVESTHRGGAIPMTCSCHDDWEQMEWIGDGEEGARNFAVLNNGGLDHRGRRRDRLRKHRYSGNEFLNWERLYIAQWVKEQKRHSGLNGGLGCLELLLAQDAERYGDKTPRPTMISQRDADVAACVIQWLGTNCGSCFWETVERNAEKERARIEARNSASVTRTKERTNKESMDARTNPPQT